MKKIPTLYQRDPATNLRTLTREVHPDCQWVLDGEGVATRKYDGQAVRLTTATAWKRREVKPGKPIPDDFEEADFDEVTGKRVGWVPIRRDDPGDRYLVEAVDALEDPQRGTYEAVGPKIQGNAEGRERHELIRHADAERVDAPRDYDALRNWLVAFEGEGVVWHHPDGRMAKIKRRDFA